MTPLGDNQDVSGTPPFKPGPSPMCRQEIVKRFPNAEEAQILALGLIWDEVVHQIVNEMLALVPDDTAPLHINIREDMVLELAQLLFWLGNRVIEKRTAGRELSDIDPVEERRACLRPEGNNTITGTAQLAYEHVWKRKMDKRWKPKSAKAIEREKNPRNPTLAIKPVGKNHFIPRWFIRDLWAADGKVLRWRRAESRWTSALRGFGEWGYRHNLYSDRLEAYFGLLEGDAKRPIEMLLDTRPLNRPQRESFIGFLIIQMLRNPFFMEAVQQELAPIIALEGYADDPTMAARAFETMFSNDDFYSKMARSLMWSRWAIVKSTTPLFVLPDTFGAQGDVGNGLRMLVPLTPNACFVTLPDREEEKRIVPRHLPADESLARRISATLVHTAKDEFLSHPEFVPDGSPAPAFGELLGEISKAIVLRDDDER